MPKIEFNPVSFLLNLVIGWFFISFLQSVARAAFMRNWNDILDRFKSIAFFRDRPAAIVNIAIIMVIWIVATSIWFATRPK